VTHPHRLAGTCTNLWLTTLLGIGLNLGCARAAPRPAADDARRCSVRTGYSPAQISAIRELRERGESLAAVARQVGGSRQDVRAVEQQWQPRRRLHPGRHRPPPTCPIAGTAGDPSAARRGP
jgi:hypothetical protein